MKKVASIIGIGAISLAVALSPAFAQQQTKPSDPVNPATVQPKQDEKGKAPGAARDEKSTSAKPGTDLRTGAATTTSPAKPGNNVMNEKAASPAKPDVKSENTPAKPGADMRATNPSHRPDADVKANAPSQKSETGVKKDGKAAPVKPGAEVKKNDKSSKANTRHAVRHARHSAHKGTKMASAGTHRNHTVKNASGKTGMDNSAKPVMNN